MSTTVQLSPHERVRVQADAGGLWLVYERPHWFIPGLWIWAGEPERLSSREAVLEYRTVGLLARVLVAEWESVMRLRRESTRAIVWHAPEAAA